MCAAWIAWEGTWVWHGENRCGEWWGEGESRGVWVWRFTEGRCLILRATTEINSKLVPLNANGAASIFKRASKFVLTPAIALNQTCN